MFPKPNIPQLLENIDLFLKLEQKADHTFFVPQIWKPKKNQKTKKPKNQKTKNQKPKTSGDTNKTDEISEVPLLRLFDRSLSIPHPHFFPVLPPVSSSFQNVVTTGNSRVLAVTPGDGPVYCYTINITPTSANVGRFARVSAYNGFSWSPFGYPTPLSATGQVVAPGAPGNVLAVPTDSYGILVTWNPPDSLTCFFGGDGGASIVFYVVEWDFRPDFRFRIFLIS